MGAGCQATLAAIDGFPRTMKGCSGMSGSHEGPVAFEAPAGACDTHFHVFGPHDRYKVASRARYEPPEALLEDYEALAGHLGIERMVFVQPSAYGTDNACMLDAMARVDPALRRGIVDIPEDLPEVEIEALHAQGVRGVRINTSPVAPHDPGRVAALTPRIETLAERLAGRGWCLEFLGPGWLTVALLPVMERLEIDYIIDHIGMFRAADGPRQEGFEALLDHARRPNCWLKLTGIYRFATAPDFADAKAMVQAAAGVAPDRLLWGSDFPHLSFETVSSVALFNLMADWFPDEADRRRVMVDNPVRLFGF